MWACNSGPSAVSSPVMRTVALALLVATVQAASAGSSGQPVAVENHEAAPPPADPEPAAVEEEDEYSEPVILRKAGIPMPPSQERKAYLAWRKKLPKKIATKLDRFCRNARGTYYQACNGIGPYAIPRPPSRVAMPRRNGAGEVIGMTVEQWQAGLSPLQNSYYQNICEQGSEDDGYSDLCGGTPIVLAFADARVEYTAGTGTDWPTATTPWLARDLDGDGAITSEAELFGSSTALADSTLARHGFQPLVELDGNRDGVLDANDPAFGSLLVWADRDGDRQSRTSELTRLADTVVEISLGYRREVHCDLRGNCEGERSSMTWRDATGALRTGSAIDVYLRYR